MEHYIKYYYMYHFQDSIYTNFLSFDSFDMPKKFGIDNYTIQPFNLESSTVNIHTSICWFFYILKMVLKFEIIENSLRNNKCLHFRP